MTSFTGIIDKMRITKPGTIGVAEYSFVLNQEGQEVLLPLKEHLGHEITLSFSSEIYCSGCGKQIKKSYGQGYCFPCTQKLAECDLCVVKPELCHFAKGTCRNEKWGQEHCFIPHIVYLACTPELKVGITREFQKLTRWHDQGATQAVAVFRMKNRYHSGLVEEFLRSYLNDRTNWKQMLITEKSSIMLEDKRDVVHQVAADLVRKLEGELLYEEVQSFSYPRVAPLVELRTLSFDEENIITGKLIGIKGQYLIFDKGVFNSRKHTGHKITLTLRDN